MDEYINPAVFDRIGLNANRLFSIHNYKYVNVM